MHCFATTTVRSRIEIRWPSRLQQTVEGLQASGRVARSGLQELSPALRTSGVGQLQKRRRILLTSDPGAGPVQIPFALGQNGFARLQLFDIRGRLVDTLVESYRNVGRYSLSWDRLDRAGRPVARGLYLLQLQSIAGNDARKLVLQQR